MRMRTSVLIIQSIEFVQLVGLSLAFFHFDCWVSKVNKGKLTGLLAHIQWKQKKHKRGKQSQKWGQLLKRTNLHNVCVWGGGVKSSYLLTRYRLQETHTHTQAANKKQMIKTVEITANGKKKRENLSNT